MPTPTPPLLLLASKTRFRLPTSSWLRSGGFGMLLHWQPGPHIQRLQAAATAYRQAQLSSEGRQRCCNRPPDDTKAKNRLPAKFVCPDTTRHLCQQVPPEQHQTQEHWATLRDIQHSCRNLANEKPALLDNGRHQTQVHRLAVRILLQRQQLALTRRTRTVQGRLWRYPRHTALPWGEWRCSCSRGPCCIA